ncbi:MAG: PocR ligand-binding domain-containing protein [Faecousia sp.]
MAVSLFSIVSKERVADVLGNLQAFTGLAVQLIDSNGMLVMSFGKSASYCAILKKTVFDKNECFQLHMKAGQRAQALGEAYIFSCHANLNHIAFPLIGQGNLLGSVIIGPFLMDTPDSTLVSDLAERYHLSASLVMDLYDELKEMTVMPPAKVNQLKKLVDHLLSPLLPGERALLMQTQQKMSQQARINETIQIYKEQKPTKSSAFFYEKEKELLAKVSSGTVTEVKALLNELIGYVLFSEGGQLETVRIRAIELTTLLSRVAISGGAKADSIYKLNSQYLSLLYQEQNLDDLCMLMQEVLEGFMSAMFSQQDKGNPYIRKALRYMSDHYSEHLELSRVAEYVQLSPSYFSSLFHQVVGVSFREQLCRIRVEESKRLLLNKQYTLADIAISMGFPDQSYYCKVFKRIVGVTPGKYRE